ncbi:unnamed protein product [marine sediment metagenome]|uniref:Uncharacterized protein n=1 Tax=marine sediment metagenome TaxID=412755 RepID=X0WJN1_9ZZZZ
MYAQKKRRLRNMVLHDLKKRLGYLKSKHPKKDTNEMKYIKYQIRKKEGTNDHKEKHPIKRATIR